jgi:putative peptidoglycan lipid II flippase
MFGLVPHGLTKLFAMFLYANHKHRKAAKIATIALALNVIISIILMNLMGAMGLALAGSIGGLVLFTLTIKEVGAEYFLNIIKSKKIFYLVIGLMISAFILYYINNLLMNWIR